MNCQTLAVRPRSPFQIGFPSQTPITLLDLPLQLANSKMSERASSRVDGQIGRHPRRSMCVSHLLLLQRYLG